MLEYKGFLEIDWENKSFNDFTGMHFASVIQELGREDSIVIWGAAERGKQVIETIRAIRGDDTLYYICFLDKDQEKHGKKFKGLEIIWPLEEVWKHISPKGNVIVVNTTGSLAIINKEVSIWKDKRTVLFNFPGSMNWQLFDHLKFDDWKYIEENKENFDKLFYEFRDDKSREVLWGILNYRVTKEPDYILQIYQQEGHYYEPDIFGKEHEWFRQALKIYVDAGAFDGDTMELIRQVTNDNYEKIICLEAGKEAFKRLKKRIETESCIEAQHCALWSEDGITYLEEEFIGKESNRIAKYHVEQESMKECEMVSLVAFDCLYPEQKVDYVKFDIEGAEIEAIKGMKHTIQRNEPVLAVSAYHRPQDILQISKLLRLYVPSYKFYLRHYGPVTDETVLYAVPNEKVGV